ncbi:MAG: hypothetical protein ACE5JP_11355 [Candidatus Bipolaricaulia bacterium]
MMQSMLDAMMTRYPMFIAMGFMIVIAALIIGANNAGNASEYYAFDKAVRDAAGRDSELALLKVGVERIGVWLPPFKFLGLGMILGGITMALGVIIKNLVGAGEKVMAEFPEDLRLPPQPKPLTARMFPMIMMMGMVILFVALFVSLWLQGVAADYWNHAIATELNPAASRSDLAEKLATIQGNEAWLTPFKFLGLAFLFTGITLALVTIIRALTLQGETLGRVLPEMQQRATVTKTQKTKASKKPEAKTEVETKAENRKGGE